MKKLTIFFIFICQLLYSQVPCPDNNSFWLDLTPTGNGNTQTSFCTYAGDYDTFTACSGVQYSISVCGGSYNSAVTMYDNSGNLLYSQNATSGSGCETFTWTSTISGVVRVLIDRANCGSNTTCTQVDITQIGNCSGGVSGNQNCDNRTQVCNDASFTGNSSGFDTQELPNDGTIDGCLTVEHQSSWYIFQISTSGTLALNITTTVDYDFAIWGPNTSCASLGTPVRCSFSGLSGNTGLGNSATDFSDGDGTGGNGGLDAWVSTLNVTAGETYIMLIDNFTANSTPFTLDWTLTGGASLNCTPLPVELYYFEVTNKECFENILSWSTISELNNDRFEIEKSTDGLDFNRIGIIDGSGNSNSIKSYNFIDKNIKNIDSYYRIKQIDYDGREKTTSIKYIKNNCFDVKLIKVTNILGQLVDENQRGIILLYYDNNTIIKKINP